ncbi:MAG: replication initiation factor domain-containing protein [Phycisphaeraceae bacterium]|nr:replication initiation factor domain-containing protein [Phycisphaeraceae bacterium]
MGNLSHNMSQPDAQEVIGDEKSSEPELMAPYLLKIVEYLAIFFGPDYEQQNFGLWMFDRCIFWPANGVRINYHSTLDGYEKTDGKITLEIPGFALDVQGNLAVMQLMQGLRILYEFQCARVDLYMDDHTMRIRPGEIYKTVYQENPDNPQEKPIRLDFTGFRVIEPKCPGGYKGRTHDEVVFGRRGSLGGGAYLRIYDKFLESKGVNRSIRYELELSAKKAKLAFAMLSNCGEDCQGLEVFTSNLASILGGCIAFVKRTGRAGDKNIDRLEVYEWWQSIIDDLGHCDSLCLRSKAEPKSVPKAVEWVDKQVIGSIQMIRQAWGGEKFWDCWYKLVEMDNRMNNTHRAALEEYREAMKNKDRMSPQNMTEFLTLMAKGTPGVGQAEPMTELGNETP